jgi:hypothetical protein
LRLGSPLLVGGILCCALVLGGCTPEAPERETQPSLLPHTDLGLTGPWAAEFQQAYDEATDPYVRNVLADGVISDAEYAEMHNTMVECMAEVGSTLTFHSFTIPNGMSTDELNRHYEECGKRAHDYPIGALWGWTTGNPDHRDQNELTVECFARAGLVDSGYSADEWLTDHEGGEVPAFITTEKQYERYKDCVDDPQDLLP